MNGYVKVYRRLLDHPIWLWRPFGPGQAWIDLFARAADEDHGDGRHRGELITSQVALGDRWGWDRGKVRDFLNWLQDEHMIEHQLCCGPSDRTLIRFINYERFQSPIEDEQEASPYLFPMQEAGKEVDKEKITTSLLKGTALFRDAESIYDAYPRHVGKADALRAIVKVLQRGTITAGALFAKVQKYAKSPAGNRGCFTPHPATWFNQGRFDDDQREWTRETDSGRSLASYHSPEQAGDFARLRARAVTVSANNQRGSDSGGMEPSGSSPTGSD